jgi:hypothetical protein
MASFIESRFAAHPRCSADVRGVMGYYTRVLTKRDEWPPHAELVAALRKVHSKAVLSCDENDPERWEALVLSHADGREIAAIERNPVSEGTLGGEEIAEFVEEIQTCKPATAVPWLTGFLRSVKVIYCFQHLSGTEIDNGAAALGAVSEAIWARGDAILQADGEGFSNEDEHHILWQFSDRVSGPWWMAVLQAGKWVPFKIDLGDTKQRAAFLEGHVP